MDDKQKRLIQIFLEEGIYVTPSNLYEPLNLDLLQYVKIIIDLEEYFGIEIDDKYLYQEELKTLNDYVNLLNKIGE